MRIRLPREKAGIGPDAEPIYSTCICPYTNLNSNWYDRGSASETKVRMNFRLI